MEGRECLVPRACRDTKLDGKVSQEGLNLGAAQDFGVAKAFGGLVEADELLDPGGVLVFGADGETTDASDLTDLVEEFHGRAPNRNTQLVIKPPCV